MKDDQRRKKQGDRHGDRNSLQEERRGQEEC